MANSFLSGSIATPQVTRYLTAVPYMPGYTPTPNTGQIWPRGYTVRPQGGSPNPNA